MPTNFYFDHFSNDGEQNLIEELIIEAIEIYGLEMYYIPRARESYDILYTEDDAPIYVGAYSIPLYIKNVDGFKGDGDFLSKFGLEIRDRMTFTMARRTFTQEVSPETALQRPREGDLIYFPLNNKVFTIKFVEHEAIFYQMGALQIYDLICELFEFSNERFNTGIDYLDQLTEPMKFDVTEEGLVLEDGSSLINELDGIPLALEDEDIESRILDSNEYFEEQGDEIINFSETDPFSSGDI